MLSNWMFWMLRHDGMMMHFILFCSFRTKTKYSPSTINNAMEVLTANNLRMLSTKLLPCVPFTIHNLYDIYNIPDRWSCIKTFRCDGRIGDSKNENQFKWEQRGENYQNEIPNKKNPELKKTHNCVSNHFTIACSNRKFQSSVVQQCATRTQPMECNKYFIVIYAMKCWILEYWNVVSR